jgi:hypothetical protein
MNINDLRTRPAHNEGAEIVINGPDGLPTDFKVKIAGIDSDRWESIVRTAELSRLKGNPIKAPTLVSQAIIEWTGLEDETAPVPFSLEIAEALLTDAPYICEQLDRALSDRRNFTKPR